MRLPFKVSLPNDAPDGWGKSITKALDSAFSLINKQVNGLTEGTGNTEIMHTSLTAAPTSGMYAQNDFIPNSNIVELGTAGNKYIIRGFRCIQTGEPGVWVQERCLTGN